MHKHLSFAIFKFVAFALLLLQIACRKQDSPSWESKFLVPLLSTEFSIANLVPDSFLVTDASGMAFIRIDEVFDLIPTDSLLFLPDTTLTQDFSVPVNLQLPSGFQLYNLVQQTGFQYKDVALTTMIVNSGEVEFNVTSALEDQVLFNYGIPKATLDGLSFGISNLLLPSGSLSNPSVYQKIQDLKGYTLDLTGDNGLGENALNIQLSAVLNPNGVGASVAANEIMLRYSSTFRNLVPYLALGYLGNSTFETGNVSSDIAFMRNVSGMIALDDISMDLDVINSIGADLKVSIEQIKGKRLSSGMSIQLDHELVGNPILLSRALRNPGNTGPQYTPVALNYQMNAQNSNLQQFIEFLPDQLEVRAKVEVNPFGNVSNGNDFIYYNSNIQLRLRTNLPLKFSADNLAFIDTIPLTVKDTAILNNIKGGKLNLLAENGFPFELHVETYFLDTLYVPLGNLVTPDLIAAAPVNSDLMVTMPQKSKITFPVSNELGAQFDKVRFVVLKARINTKPGDVLLPMMSNYRLKMKLIGDLNYRVTL